MSASKSSLRDRHPSLFLPTTDIDRRKGKRTVPMEVLNLSFPRTGTMSMQTALNILGYTCYHSSIFFSNIRDCTMWDEALDAKFFNKGPKFTRADWDQLLGSHSAVSADPPPIAFAEDLVEAYPEAKVILVERDLEAWYRSFSATVTAGVWSGWINFVADMDPSWLGAMRDTHKRWAVGWFEATNKQDMLNVSRQKYREHYALVRRVTPKDRLLEYQLSDGWEPLCRFLGKPVPDVPFPRVNDSEAVWEQMNLTVKRALRNTAVRVAKYGLPCGVALLGWWLYGRVWS